MVSSSDSDEDNIETDSEYYSSSPECNDLILGKKKERYNCLNLLARTFELFLVMLDELRVDFMLGINTILNILGFNISFMPAKTI
jgi:hypothetical protein